MTVLERVTKIYAETANVAAARVEATTNLMEPPVEFADEGGFDSLDRAEFYLGVEDEFGVELPDWRCIDFRTIADVVAHVETELARQG